MKVRSCLFLLVCFALLAFPSFAGAAVTSSNIASPTTFTIAVWNENTSTGSINVSGTATGSPGDSVDIRCYRNPAAPIASEILAANVPVVAGSFAATNASIGATAASTCTLRAVPSGTTPADLSPFTGPGVGLNYEETTSPGGKMSDYYRFFAQRSGSFDYNAAGSDGLWDSYLNNPQDFSNTTSVFYGNQYFNHTPSGTQSTLRIDGVNAFGGENGATITTVPGYQPLSLSQQLDLATGNAVINESQVLMTCPANAYPPSAVNCSGVSALPVRLDRTIRQDHDGLVSTITDNYVSTDGRPHSLSVGYNQDFCHSPASCDAAQHQFAFPGKAPVTEPTAGTVIDGPFPSSSTIFATDPSTPDGAMSSGRGAITIFPAADNAVANGPRKFSLNWNNRTVPAAGSLRIAASFAHSYTQSQLNSLAADGARAITPQPSLGTVKPSAKYDKKLKRVKLITNQSVACPTDGAACVITAKVQTKVKLPAKKSKKKKAKKKKGAKKPKARYKTYKFKALVVTGAPGSTTVLQLVLPKSANSLLKKNKKLSYTIATSVDAGPYASTSGASKFTAKSPKFPKAKKKSRAKKKSKAKK